MNFLEKVFQLQFMIGNAWLSLVAFAQLTCQNFLLNLFPAVTTANWLCILYLYNHIVVTAAVWKWILTSVNSVKLVTTDTSGIRASSTHWLSEIDGWTTFRSSHPEVLLGKVLWKYAANLQENTHTEERFQ